MATSVKLSETPLDLILAPTSLDTSKTYLVQARTTSAVHVNADSTSSPDDDDAFVLRHGEFARVKGNNIWCWDPNDSNASVVVEESV